MIGFFGPWIPHKTAALTVTGYDLSEFTKFFPAVQGGTVPTTRALFLMPLLAAAVIIGLQVRRPGFPPAARMLGVALAGALILFTLPPPESIFASEYRPQLLLSVTGALLVALTTLSGSLYVRIRGAWLTVMALTGLGLVIWQFLLLRPLVTDLYNAPVRPGWGLILCLSGLVVLALLGVRDALGGRTSIRPERS